MTWTKSLLYMILNTGGPDVYNKDFNTLSQGRLLKIFNLLKFDGMFHLNKKKPNFNKIMYVLAAGTRTNVQTICYNPQHLVHTIPVIH